MKAIPELFPYQKEGVRFLKNRKFALLADEMGLGKTAQAIVAAQEIGAKSILILCPAIARFVWFREIEKFAHVLPEMRVLLCSGESPLPDGITICSYDLAADLLARTPYHLDLLILDECHYLKNREAARTRTVLGKAGWVRLADRTWALSGTPAPNHAAELWPLLFTFGQTKLRYSDFVRRYCNFFETTWGARITGTKMSSVAELQMLLLPVMLRRIKLEVLPDLPELLFGEVVVQPGAIDVDAEMQRKADAEKAQLQAILDRGGDLISALEGLAQSVSTLRRLVGLQKVFPAAKLIEEELELGLYSKIVVFGSHVDVLKGLWQELYAFNPALVIGETSANDRQREVGRFQNDPECKVFLGNIQAAGTAISLTAASQVLFVEQDWVPGNNAQALSRCHRIGQKSTCVNIRFMSLVDSLDFRVTEILEKKTRELFNLFDKSKQEEKDGLN